MSCGALLECTEWGLSTCVARWYLSCCAGPPNHPQHLCAGGQPREHHQQLVRSSSNKEGRAARAVWVAHHTAPSLHHAA